MPEFRSLANVLAKIAPVEEALVPLPLADSTLALETAADVALSGARLMRAHLRELLDAALQDLLRDIACEIVGRELRLEPVELTQIVEAALEGYRAAIPLRVRVHPDDVACLNDVVIEVHGDSMLRRGDAHLELRDGSIDLSLGVRLERLLQRVR